MTNCTHCECKPSAQDKAAIHGIREIKEIVGDLYHRALMLTEAEDPASEKFSNLVDGLNEAIQELKTAHRSFQRHIFCRVITKGMREMHRQGLCPEVVKLTDDLGNHFDFQIHSDGEVAEGPELCF